MPYSLLYAKAIATGSAILMGGLGIDKVIGRPSRTHYFVRGSSDKDDLSLGHHHSSKGHPSYSHSGSQSDDTSFDFYIYTMTYQPEFCRENSSRSFAGCQKPDEFWEGQLTIHGLWPEVSLIAFLNVLYVLLGLWFDGLRDFDIMSHFYFNSKLFVHPEK